jgi:hypothetical protein
MCFRPYRVEGQRSQERECGGAASEFESPHRIAARFVSICSPSQRIAAVEQRLHRARRVCLQFTPQGRNGTPPDKRLFQARGALAPTGRRPAAGRRWRVDRVTKDGRECCSPFAGVAWLDRNPGFVAPRRLSVVQSSRRHGYSHTSGPNAPECRRHHFRAATGQALPPCRGGRDRACGRADASLAGA